MKYRDLVAVLDKEFSTWVRASSAEGAYARCYTCGKIGHWKTEMDAGHFIGREYTGTRWNPENVKPQCQSCNRFHEGEKARFALHLIQDGVDVNKLQAIADMWGLHHPTNESMLEQIAKYRKLNKALLDRLKEYD